MEKVAFISGTVFLYWSSIVLTLAVIAGVFAFLNVFLKKKKKEVAAAAFGVPMAIVLSAVLGRLLHWYCRTDSYASFTAAMTDYSWGSYALAGAFAGCALTAIVLRVLQISKNLPHMLDSASIGLGTAIAVGRLASFFNASDRGLIVPAEWGLPVAYPVVNPVSGLEENRLATFLLQGIVTGCIVLGLLLYSRVMRKRKHGFQQGDMFLMFLTCYCASQVFFDSTRYDSLFLRSNGFVSIVQILAAAGLLFAMGSFSATLFTNKRKFLGAVLWILFLAATGGAGYMEYYVQRHGDQAHFAYTNMIACLCAVVVIITITRHLSIRVEGKKKGRFSH